MDKETLYHRLGGYDGITVIADDLLVRLQEDSRLGRFWENRGDDGIAREKQLLVDFLSSCTGGPVYYTGRDMKTTHLGMGICENDWVKFLEHAGATFEALQVPKQECDEVVEFVLGLKDEILDN